MRLLIFMISAIAMAWGFVGVDVLLKLDPYSPVTGGILLSEFAVWIALVFGVGDTINNFGRK